MCPHIAMCPHRKAGRTGGVRHPAHKMAPITIDTPRLAPHRPTETHQDAGIPKNGDVPTYRHAPSTATFPRIATSHHPGDIRRPPCIALELSVWNMTISGAKASGLRARAHRPPGGHGLTPVHRHAGPHHTGQHTPSGFHGSTPMPRNHHLPQRISTSKVYRLRCTKRNGAHHHGPAPLAREPTRLRTCRLRSIAEPA